jgi:hypothetical protein
MPQVGVGVEVDARLHGDQILRLLLRSRILGFGRRDRDDHYADDAEQEIGEPDPDGAAVTNHGMKNSTHAPAAIAKQTGTRTRKR